MKNIVILSLLSLLIFGGCQKETIVNPSETNSTGNLFLKYDSENTPENVETITATLTRSGYSNLSLTMDILTDTTAATTFTEVPVGVWHLKVDAKDVNGTVVYTGETDVDVLAGITVQVTLTLNSTGQGTGNIYIFVRWGQSNTFSSGWMDYNHNPVLLRDNSFYDINGISHPTILYENGTYKMWYNCMAADGKSYTFYATSPDGNTWTKRSTPVLSPSTYWDNLGTVVHSVLKDGNYYKAYYTGISYGYTIGLATSPDGIIWEKNTNPVLSGTSGWETNVSSGEVVKVNDSTYYMYYHGISQDYQQYKIGLAISPDGVNFTRFNGNPILSKTSNWEEKGPCTPTVIKEQNQFIMVYQNSEADGRSLGMAYSSNGLNWAKDPASPFFGCPDTYNGWASGYCSYPCLRKINNEYRIYYSGSNFFDQKTAKIGYTKKQL